MNSDAVQPVRVLIVEDDSTTRRSMERLFRLNGAEVATAACASEAIARLAWDPHWVILDLRLQEDDGEAVLRAIRSSGHPAKVAVVTGSADRARVEALRDLAPDCVLIKPIQFSTLLQCVDLAQVG